jgi:monoamine oxidase
VLLASYTWGQAARRLGVLIHKDAEEFVKHNLAKFHPQLATEEKLLDRIVTWNWDTHKWSSGAFAWFLPGQHSALHQHIVAPEGRIYLAGEHASLTHTWMQGALDSAVCAVIEILKSSHQTP